MSLHNDEIDVLLDHLGLGRWVPPFQLSSPSPDLATFAKQQDRVWERLQADRYATPHGLLGPVRDLIEAWANPVVTFTHVATVIGTPNYHLYRAGWRGDVGFMSRQEGDTFTIEALRPPQVVNELLAMLPDMPPINARPVTILDEAPKAQDDFSNMDIRGDQAYERQTATREAMAPFTTAPLTRFGRIKCTRREPTGPTRSGDTANLATLTWFDNAAGRYFLVEERLPDGALHISVNPANNARLAQWLRQRTDESNWR